MGLTSTASNRGHMKAMLWAVLGLLFAAMVAVAVYKAWPLIYPQAAVIAAPDPDCDLHNGPCTVRFAQGGEVSLDIEPRQIPLVRPLRLTVTLHDLNAQSAEIDFSGVDMNMGYNRVLLEQTAPGRYQGKGMLPVCVRRRMSWEAKVMLHRPEGNWVAPFRFDTYRAGDS